MNFVHFSSIATIDVLYLYGDGLPYVNAAQNGRLPWGVSMSA